MMAHAQKPDFVFRRNGRVHLNRRGASVQSTGSRGVRISGRNAGYTMLRGSVKGTGYPLHSTFSPSLPLPCVTVCHHVVTGLYRRFYVRNYTAVRVPIIRSEEKDILPTKMYLHFFFDSFFCFPSFSSCKRNGRLGGMFIVISIL